MKKKEMLAMVFAGGQKSRLGVLTDKTAKPAVAFGGKYRIIDFLLSNCINSGIDTVGVLIPYSSCHLIDHIGIGIPWDLDRNYGGVTLLPPGEKTEGSSWYAGTADAVCQNMEYIDSYDPEYVLILSGDQVYKMDYDIMLNFHKEKEAAVTIACHPEQGKESAPASMGIYIFNWDVLRKVLIRMKEVENCDFEKHILPECVLLGEKIFTYEFRGYWKCIETLDDYWSANMELIDILPEFNLYEDFWKIYTNSEDAAPMYVGDTGFVERSIVSEHTDVEGSVINSVISPGVVIGKGAEVRDSIIMRNTVIGQGSRICHVILSEGVRVGENCIIGTGDHLVTIGENTLIPDGSTWIKAGEER